MSSNVSSIRILNNEAPELDFESMMEIRMTLEQMKSVTKSVKVFHKPSTSIEDQLMKKQKKSQAILAEKRLKKRSQDLDNLTPVPRISTKSAKLSYSRYKSQTKMLQTNNTKKPESQIEDFLIRPQDTIPGPDLLSLKQSFSARGQLKKIKNPAINPFKLSLIEKTKFFLNKKIAKVKKEQKKKTDELKKECTFKPDLTKSTPRHKRSAGTMHEIFMTEECKTRDETAKSPAPKPMLHKEKSQSINFQKNYLMENYHEISPAKGIYGFKEGVNLKQLIGKSRPMMNYCIAKNY
ncbi:hypothetical protein SteCoe_6262 [Stentor coeruleus]|uniref:Uncharacterized protein n=1 Tax=Stentor coeruleus TaxID=5963 RepID=A0A1R2CQD2_9CILI|nr:hypothetical protein SteCoe_6262 [Stentor coeruleus]